MTNKILVIAGMHRSGTSLISQWLYQCGLNLGENLLQAGIGNDDGHFEDLDFLRFNSDALIANNLPGNGYVHHPLPKLSPYYEERLKRILDFKNEMNNEWGWKEPRSCLFIDYYRTLIPEAYYLVIFRNFNATVSSLIQRELKNEENRQLSRGWIKRLLWKNIRRAKKQESLYVKDTEFYLKVWITYNEALLKAIQSLPNSQFIVTDYVRMQDYDQKIFNKLVGKWNFTLNHIDFKTIFKKKLLSKVVEIDSFVKDKQLLEKAALLEEQLGRYAEITVH